jgi:Flp pilus assembly protein TadB
MWNNSPPSVNPQNVWLSQRLEGTRMSVDDLRRKAAKFRTKISWRNAREYAAALVVAVFLAFQYAHTPEVLTRVGFGLMILGMCYLVWQLHRQGAARTLPAEMGLASGLEFFKRELERQRDMLQSVAKWYLAPLLPGYLVLEVAFARTNPGHLKHFVVSFIIFNLVTAVVVVFIWKLNQRAARRLQERIDDLNSLAEPR